MAQVAKDKADSKMITPYYSDRCDDKRRSILLMSKHSILMSNVEDGVVVRYVSVKQTLSISEHNV